MHGTVHVQYYVLYITDGLYKYCSTVHVVLENYLCYCYYKTDNN